MALLPTKKLNPNMILFKEGSIGEIAYILKKGRIEISVTPADEKLVLAVLKPPAVFGEMALLFKEEKRTATAKALEYTELIQVGREELDIQFKKSPKIIVHILDALVRRLRNTTERVGKSPDKFIGVCEVLNLMSLHKQEEFLYSETISAIAHALNIDPVQVKEKLELLQDFNLIDIMLGEYNKKSIRLVDASTFINKARKLHQAKGGLL